MSLNLVEMWKELDVALKDLDTKLDSRDGGTSNAKATVIESLIQEAAGNVEQVSTALVSQLDSVSDEQKIGFFYGLIRSLEKLYGEPAKKLVEIKAEQLPKQEPLISEDEVPAIMEKRKAVYAQIKSVMDMAEAFNDTEALAVIEKPRRRGGAPKGKRGPRAISFVEWSIDGKTYEKLANVVEEVPQYDKVKDLTAAMRADKINLTDPPARIEFTLPNGKVLVGVNTLKQESDDDDDDDTNDDTGTVDNGDE